jgi:anti-sigma regulatory factor (Ser/Thr protein kinase)
MQGVVHSMDETYEARASSVPRARTKLAEFAGAAGATPHQVDAVRLAVSEALTNAVVHAYREEPGSIYVNAAVLSGELSILISDDGCGLEPRADRPGLGLGLGLISRLSDDFAIVSRSSGGTEVRIRFNLEPPMEEDGSGPRAGARRSRGGTARRSRLTSSMSLASTSAPPAW